jgi:hypothetical protein
VATSDQLPLLRRWRWLRRLLIAAVVTPGAIALVGFLILPPIVRHVAAKQLTSLLGRRVTLERVRMNPFKLSVTVEGLQIYERDGLTPFLGFARFHVNTEAASLYRRAQRMLELVKAGSAVPSVDDVRLDPADYPRLLEKAYDAETFQKPRNFLGAAKSLPPAEMERLMLAHVGVGDDALLTLAQRRAAAVREALAGQAQGARLFLVAPKISARPGNRVELRLKND